MIAPVGGVLEELVVAEVLDVEVEAAAVAPVDGAAAHVGEVVVRQVPVVAHVDGLPHGGVQAEGAPVGAHQLRCREDLDGAELQQDRRRDIPRELQPVGRRRGLVGGRHGEGGAERPPGFGWRGTGFFSIPGTIRAVDTPTDLEVNAADNWNGASQP